MLILLIGCAINGDSKEHFIEKIQQNIDTHIQIDLVPFIELVTEDMNFSISKNLKLALEMHSPDTSISSTSSFIQTCQQLIQNQQQTNNNTNNNNNGNHHQNHVQPSNDILINKLLTNIQRIIDERDLFSESIIELQQDKDFLLKQLNQNGINGLLLSNNNMMDANSSCLNDVNNGVESHHDGNKMSNDNNMNCEMNLNSNSGHHHDSDRQLDVNNKGNSATKQQKLSMELVECKVKMRQLRMEV